MMAIINMKRMDYLEKKSLAIIGGCLILIQKNHKKDIVEEVLNKRINSKDKKELLNMLVSDDFSIDSDKSEDKKRTFGDKLADKVTEIAGSWAFIMAFISFLVIWMLLNYFEVLKLDAFPFVLLNLILSCIAALQAPIIMMSENRAAKKDSLRSLNDYKTDLKSELILEILYDELVKLKKNQDKILKNMKKEE